MMFCRSSLGSVTLASFSTIFPAATSASSSPRLFSLALSASSPSSSPPPSACFESSFLVGVRPDPVFSSTKTSTRLFVVSSISSLDSLVTCVIVSASSTVSSTLSLERIGSSTGVRVYIWASSGASLFFFLVFGFLFDDFTPTGILDISSYDDDKRFASLLRFFDFTRTASSSSVMEVPAVMVRLFALRLGFLFDFICFEEVAIVISVSPPLSSTCS